MMINKKEKKLEKMSFMEMVENPERRISRYALILTLFWTLFILIVQWRDYVTHKTNIENLAIKEVRANFNKDQAFRYWAALHGGLYVPVTEKTPPNPYLRHVEERDIKTPSGQELTLINPAYMVRQMNEFFRDLYGVAGHITSLKPHRPGNEPDEWERESLLAFESGVEEVLSFTNMNGEPYVRLMKPMMTKDGCIKCHGYQGYKVGDVRGGVSVTVSLKEIYDSEWRHFFKDTLTLGFVWITGLVAIYMGYRRLKKHLREREKVQEELRLSEKRLNRGQEVGHVGTWDWNPGTGELLWSDEIYRILGYKPGEIVPSYELFLGHLMSDDRKRLSRAVEGALSEKEIYNIDCSVVRKDGLEIIANARGEVSFDERGNPLQMVGTFQDITERKKTEERLIEQLDELRRWNSLNLDREERVMELKEEVNALLKELGKEERYSKIK